MAEAAPPYKAAHPGQSGHSGIYSAFSPLRNRIMLGDDCVVTHPLGWQVIYAGKDQKAPPQRLHIADWFRSEVSKL